MASKRCIILAVGGTGGHIYPALALAKRLKEDPNSSILFLGGRLSENRHFAAADFPFHSVSCGTLSLKNLWKILKGVQQSYQLIKQTEPDLVVGFGSYHSFPVLAASFLAQVPVILHEANSIPGKVNRLFSYYASWMGAQFPLEKVGLKCPVKQVSFLLREGFHKEAVSKEEARRYFQLSENCPAVLAFGGSQGARALNECVEKTAMHFGKSIQWIHITGNADSAANISQIYSQNGLRACVKAYENRMDLAWRAADLGVVRAGAGTIAEIVAFEVPSLLVPYPFAADKHQDANADFLTAQIGGGIKCCESELTPQLLIDLLSKLLFEGSRELQIMQQAIYKYKAKRQLSDFVQMVMDYK
jgi:UDP-N-acetylglucosamine--N-acetylmuramyl-(pentapeptide) pyrophosphoryl-undecaprenol N-acetylglucosamine transferase